MVKEASDMKRELQHHSDDDLRSLGGVDEYDRDSESPVF
jgi:hypothetical protein